MEVRGRRVTVMGLGRHGGGVAVARWLAEQGAIVTITDMATPGRCRIHRTRWQMSISPPGTWPGIAKPISRRRI